MAEYIDLDTPLEVKVARGSTYEPYTSTLRELLDVNHIPYAAADVRPVVLCRDCIFRSNKWTGCPKLNGTITGDEFFCKCGIKREES